MSRSVYVPKKALFVTYSDYDTWGNLGEVIGNIQDRFKEISPSSTKCSKWESREGHIIMENRLAYFGVSEYIGLLAYWLIPKEEYPSLADEWIYSISPRLIKEFGTLIKAGTASNGESFFRRI